MPPSMSRATSYAYNFSVFGVSIASFVGLLKAFNFWKRAKDRARLAQEQIEELKTLLAARDTELAALRDAIDMERATATAKEDLTMLLKGEIGRTKSQLTEAERQLKSSRDQNQSLALQLTNQARESTAIKDELYQVKAKHAQTLELLDSRTSELKGAQAFLTKADSLSGADVITMLEDLNADILQTAAIMADSFEFGERTEGWDATEEVQAARARIAEIWDDRMVHLLGSTDHQDDPMFIQVAFQACMSAYSEWMISSWYFDNPQEEQFLADIYQRVRTVEDQAVAGRWRALTRSHIHGKNEIQPNLIAYFVEGFLNILIVAGCKGSMPELQDRITERFSDRMRVVAEKAFNLNKAIGQGITSSDIEVMIVSPEEVFDASSMEDAFDPEKSAEAVGKDLHVICTTDLGLLRAVKVQGLPEWNSTILLKPKVMLETSLNEISKGDDETSQS